MIGTIPAQAPIDRRITAILEILLGNSIPTGTKPSLEEDQLPQRILLEMAYTPSVTPLMQMASKNGWHTMP